MTLSSPRQKTIKRLFAVSGNQCYFPNCFRSIVNEESGKVIGKICHIKGRKPGAARYDPNQTDEERHGFDNLVLMCSLHHDVIDDDPVSYTVSRLKEMKAEHEKNHAGGVEPSEENINQLYLSISKGSLISTKDQKGGQVANKIYNINYSNDLQSDELSQKIVKKQKEKTKVSDNNHFNLLSFYSRDKPSYEQLDASMIIWEKNKGTIRDRINNIITELESKDYYLRDIRKYENEVFYYIQSKEAKMEMAQIFFPCYGDIDANGAIEQINDFISFLKKSLSDVFCDKCEQRFEFNNDINICHECAKKLIPVFNNYPIYFKCSKCEREYNINNIHKYCEKCGNRLVNIY